MTSYLQKTSSRIATGHVILTNDVDLQLPLVEVSLTVLSLTVVQPSLVQTYRIYHHLLLV